MAETELIDETGRVVFRGTQSPGGGSQTVSVIDCGVIQVADVVAAGALVLVPAAEGRLIKSVRFGLDEYDPPSDGSQLWLITRATSGYSGYAYLASDGNAHDTLALLAEAANVGPGPTGGGSGYAMILDTGPLVAGSGLLGQPGQEFIQPGTWQPNTPYTLASTLLDPNGHVQAILNGENGVSGGVEPVWNDSGGATVDGTATWFDLGLPPTGSFHAYAEIVETGNPSPPYPASIEYVQQPTDATAAATISPAVTVRILDQHGDPYETIASTVALFILGAGTLTGTTTKTTVAGVATFDDLAITEPGSGYVLQAVIYPSILIAAVDSDPFDITAP